MQLCCSPKQSSTSEPTSLAFRRLGKLSSADLPSCFVLVANAGLVSTQAKNAGLVSTQANTQVPSSSTVQMN